MKTGTWSSSGCRKNQLRSYPVQLTNTVCQTCLPPCNLGTDNPEMVEPFISSRQVTRKNKYSTCYCVIRILTKIETINEVVAFVRRSPGPRPQASSVATWKTMNTVLVAVRAKGPSPSSRVPLGLQCKNDWRGRCLEGLLSPSSSSLCPPQPQRAFLCLSKQFPSRAS